MDYRTAIVQLPLVRDTPAKVVRSPPEVAALCSDMVDLAQETFHVLALNAKNRLITRSLISLGTVNSAMIHARDVFRTAIVEHASAIVIVHNHPSGDPTPSAEDVRITRQLVEAGKLLDITVIDHVILGRKSEGNPGFLSMRETRLVDFIGEKP